MFSKSEIFEEFLEFYNGIPKDDVRMQIDVLGGIIRRFKESGVYNKNDKVGQFPVTQCLYTQNKEFYIQSSKFYIEDKIVNSTLDQLAIIVSAFMKVGAIIQCYNYELTNKINMISTKLKDKSYDVNFLNDAVAEFYAQDNRACITSLASMFEHILRVRLISLKSTVTPKTMLGQLLDDINIGKVMQQDEIDIVRDIAYARNAKGAHGSIVYDSLTKAEMENLLKTGLNVLDNIKI